MILGFSTISPFISLWGRGGNKGAGKGPRTGAVPAENFVPEWFSSVPEQSVATIHRDQLAVSSFHQELNVALSGEMLLPGPCPFPLQGGWEAESPILRGAPL